MRFGSLQALLGVVFTCALSSVGCSSSTDNAGSGLSTGANANGAGNVPAATAGGPNLNVDPANSNGSAMVGNGTLELCDGIDNDANGVIDDVDKNGDGVCDCLLIATLGVKGSVGQGDVFATWLTMRSNNGASDLADQTLTPELLDKYQVIVAQDLSKNHQYSEAEVSALSAWVNKGGGFMTLIGYTTRVTEVDNVNLLLKPFGMSYTPMRILPKTRNTTYPITTWVPHPIDTGVTQVGVDSGYPVAGMGTTIATGGGYDVAKAQAVASGHVFMWADEWITYNSEWQTHPEYQVELLWLNSIKWLTVAGKCQVAIPQVPK